MNESKDERIRNLEAELAKYKAIAAQYRASLGDVRANCILLPLFHSMRLREIRDSQPQLSHEEVREQFKKFVHPRP